MATPIRGIDRIAVEAALANIRAVSPNDVRPDDTALYCQAIVSLCVQFELRHTVLLAQALHETGNFGPAGRWANLNPAGLGITSSSDSTPFVIKNGTEAARLHVWSMLIALREWETADRIFLPASATSWRNRWQNKYADPACPKVNNVEDLNLMYSGDRATWATDPGYATKLLATMNRVFPTGSGEGENKVKDSEGFVLNMTPGLIPEAGATNRLVPDSKNKAWNNLGQRVIRGFVLHRMLGSLGGTDTYFHSGAPALTDNGQDADSDLVYLWNDPTGAPHPGVSANRAPHATGPYRATAYGDGRKFVNKYGVNAVNRDQRSWEIDGWYGDPWTQSAMREAAQTCAHDAHNYGITWEAFPYSDRDGCSFVRWHNEYTGLDYKECPGSVVMNQTDQFIGMVKAIMKAAQQTGVPVDPTEPVEPIPVSPIPKGASIEWLRAVYGELTVPWASKPFVFDLERSECRQWLAYCTSSIPPGGDYTAGNWGEITQCIRRGNKGDKGRDFMYANGLVIHQEPPNRQTGEGE